jgi:hypothetical protein
MRLPIVLEFLLVMAELLVVIGAMMFLTWAIHRLHDFFIQGDE